MVTKLIISTQVLHILLSVALGEKHGYEIMKDVIKSSEGQIKLGPGTLYGALKRLLFNNLIVEIDKKETDYSEKRRYYKLTESGRILLSSELDQLNRTLERAKSLKLLKNNFQYE